VDTWRLGHGPGKESTLGGKTRPPWAPEFRAEAVRVVRAGGTIHGVARDLGCSTQSLRHWVRQAEIDDGQQEGLTSEEREELARLKRRVRVLEQERDPGKSGRLLRLSVMMPLPGGLARFFAARSKAVACPRSAACRAPRTCRCDFIGAWSDLD